MTDMIRVNTANTVNTTINRVSAVAAASICSIGVSAEKIICNPVMIKLSVITSHPFDSINYMAELFKLVLAFNCVASACYFTFIGVVIISFVENVGLPSYHRSTTKDTPSSSMLTVLNASS